MLHLRVISPSERTGDVLNMLAAEPGGYSCDTRTQSRCRSAGRCDRGRCSPRMRERRACRVDCSGPGEGWRYFVRAGGNHAVLLRRTGGHCGPREDPTRQWCGSSCSVRCAKVPD